MAAWGSHFLIVGDFDAVMTIIHAVMLEATQKYYQK